MVDEKNVNEVQAENKDDNSEDKSITSNTNTTVDKILQLFESDFAKFTAIITATLTFAAWLLRGVWYFFKLGEFYLYKINACYITPSDDSVIFQIIKVIIIAVDYIILNAFFYWLISKKDKNKYKKYGLVFIVSILEITFCYLIIIYIYGYNIIKAVLELFVYAKTNPFFFILFCMMIFFSINSLSLVFYFMRDKTKAVKLQKVNKDSIDAIKNEIKQELMQEIVHILNNKFNITIKEKKKRKNNKLKNKKAKEDKNKKVFAKWKDAKTLKLVLVTIGGTIAFEAALITALGFNEARSRHDYKVVYETMEYQKESNDKYIFKYDNEQLSKKIYIVTFENEEVYILSPLYKENDEIKIDFSQQRIIDKINITTIYYDNISNIDKGN